MRKLNPSVKSALETIGNFFFTFVTALVILLALGFVIIKILGWNMFSVDSGSMAPLYPVDTLIVLQDISPEEIQTGDVITYVLNEDGLLVTHRVVDVDRENQLFTTKGDANNNEDPPVMWGNVVGKVVLGIPLIGKPIRFLTDPANRPLVIGIIVALFAVSLIWDLLVRRRKKSPQLATEQNAAGQKEQRLNQKESDSPPNLPPAD